MRKAITTMYAGLAWIILAAVGAQFFLVGLGLFGATDLGAHRLVGYLTIPASLLLLILALVGRVGGARIGQSAALLGLTIVQSFLPKAPSLIAALHPVNAVVILFVALNLARNGVRDRASARSAATATGVGSAMSGGR